MTLYNRISYIINRHTKLLLVYIILFILFLIINIVKYPYDLLNIKNNNIKHIFFTLILLIIMCAMLYIPNKFILDVEFSNFILGDNLNDTSFLFGIFVGFFIGLIHVFHYYRGIINNIKKNNDINFIMFHNIISMSMTFILLHMVDKTRPLFKLNNIPLYYYFMGIISGIMFGYFSINFF